MTKLKSKWTATAPIPNPETKPANSPRTNRVTPKIVSAKSDEFDIGVASFHAFGFEAWAAHTA
jgi:hypothetical protein